jgi:3-isopropylmalate/(R)-2-methylmalate dehydratase small subunit
VSRVALTILHGLIAVGKIDVGQQHQRPKPVARRQRVHIGRNRGTKDEMAGIHRQHHKRQRQERQRTLPEVERGKLGGASKHHQAHHHGLISRKTGFDRSGPIGDAKRQNEHRNRQQSLPATHQSMSGETQTISGSRKHRAYSASVRDRRSGQATYGTVLWRRVGLANRTAYQENLRLMEKFTTLTSVAAPMPVINVDTDMIIPKQFLKTIKRTGLGKSLFYEMRFNEDGTENADFVLNKPAYRGANILVAGDNFGCGSSREHAPWALLDYGIRCVISTSFADIFYNNCFKNGILPIVVTPEELDKLMDDAQRGSNATLSIDLKAKPSRAPTAARSPSRSTRSASTA